MCMMKLLTYLSILQGSLAFTIQHKQYVGHESNSSALKNVANNNGDHDSDVTINQSRRNFFKNTSSAIISGSILGSSTLSWPMLAAAEDEEKEVSQESPTKKILVLGGTGFVGQTVCKKLLDLGISYIATSRDGRDGTEALDFTDSSINISSKVENLAKGCSAVISCIGSIGTESDKVVNSGTGLAAIGAKAAGVQRFVYVSVAPEVRGVGENISFLEGYMEGKAFSEESIQKNFVDSSVIIAPTFIYGGDKFSVNPPRVAEGYGNLVEGVLSSGPFRFAASIAPGIIGIALEPPVKVTSVANAAIAGALGLSQAILDTHDEINDAAKLI